MYAENFGSQAERTLINFSASAQELAGVVSNIKLSHLNTLIKSDIFGNDTILEKIGVSPNDLAILKQTTDAEDTNATSEGITINA